MKFTLCTLLALFLASFSICNAKATHTHKNEVTANKTTQNHSKYQLTLYYKAHCPYCVKVNRYLRALGREVPLKNARVPSYEKELIKIGGKRQVPCLVIDGKALYESDAIIDWLKAHRNEI
ncbi:hypothetical protein COB11_02045 [Candidatus Aerophobetes bacterium]|uniref:GST N-terminal domain-containing protein n=1 Tax=Aerophobetes bacterium TaxID=2030807 RepID=A0A2A4YMD8_UNCAE|nr:MAG: hypothetical protein COB11_02045 [Candidatus Aerophobetes bacterium]